MDISEHAIKRCRQRGIQEYLLEIIQDLGTKEKRPYGAMRTVIGKREVDRLIHEMKIVIHHLEKLKRRKVAVVTSDGPETIITSYGIK